MEEISGPSCSAKFVSMESDIAAGFVISNKACAPKASRSQTKIVGGSASD